MTKIMEGQKEKKNAANKREAKAEEKRQIGLLFADKCKTSKG